MEKRRRLKRRLEEKHRRECPSAFKPAACPMNRLGDCPSYFCKSIDSPSYTALLLDRGGKPALRERGFTKITMAWPGG